MGERVLILGTRGSKLALEQARRVQQRLPGASKVRIIGTAGDRNQEAALSEQEGVGFFTKEIQQELLAGTIDLAVHSLKDLPTAHPVGLTLGAVLPRDEVSDLLLVRPEAMDTDRVLPLRHGAHVGTSSLRRQALLDSLRADLTITPIRGNLPTRVAKVARGDYDATLVSRAGPVRLGQDVTPLVAFDLNPRRWVCAPGQGVIAVEIRAKDQEARARVATFDHPMTRTCVQAERKLHQTFGGGCHAPFGAFARIEGYGTIITVAAPDQSGVMQVAVFSAAELDEAQRAADAWLRAGRPAIENEIAGQWATDKGQRTTDKRQGTRDKGQRTTDNGQRTRDNGQGTRDNDLLVARPAKPWGQELAQQNVNAFNM